MKTGWVLRLFCKAAFPALLVSCGGVSFSLFYSTLDRSEYSGIDAFRVAVVSDASAWRSLWNAHMSGRFPATLPPPIDFSTRMVVAVFLGPRPNACHTVRIDDIFTTPDRVVVQFSERRPGPNEICAQVITSPAHLVTVARTPLPFEFIKTN